MCEAERIWIEELEADALKRGEANGLKKGREEGEANGLKKGLEKGREEGEATGLKKGLEKGREEGEATGLKKGREEVMRDIVHSMIAQKFDDNIITYTTGMPLARIQAMRHEMQLL